jgi:hypothetical protein
MKACDNPFSADRIDHIPYKPIDTSLENILLKLEQMNYRAAIIGPEGSGKTTLLENLKNQLSKFGFNINSVFLNDTNPFTTKKRKELLALLQPDTIVLMDGADQLSRLAWHRLKTNILQSAHGLIITSHKPNLLPTLLACSTSPQLFTELAASLWPDDRPVDHALLRNIFNQHDGNIRLAFRHLYDYYSNLPQ